MSTPNHKLRRGHVQNTWLHNYDGIKLLEFWLAPGLQLPK